MKVAYYRDTDSLYIDLAARASSDSREIAEGMVLDYDAAGGLVGIDIDNASKRVDIDRVVLSGIQPEVEPGG